MFNCKLCLVGSSAILAAVVGLSVPAAIGQPEKPKTTPAAPAAAQPSGQPTPEDWAKMSATVDEHKQMAAIVGEWDAASKFWMDPSQPPEESKGTSSNKAIFGGRYIQSDFKGDMMGQPFEGMAIWSFNKISGKYESTWIDSMSTSIAFSEDGSFDKAKKAWNSTMSMWDPMTGQKITCREVVILKSADSHVMEMYCAGPDGKEFKNMEITYTRKGVSKPGR